MTDNDGRGHVEFKFRVVRQTRVGSSAGVQARSKLAIFGCAALLVGMLCMLWFNVGFWRYALTGYFWAETAGTVVSPGRTSTPIIQYKTKNGAIRSFSEDYVLLCGGRSSFCFIRDFDHGDTVPVVYDPSAPARVFVDDWALRANVISWFVEAGVALFLSLVLFLVVTRKSINVSYKIG